MGRRRQRSAQELSLVPNAPEAPRLWAKRYPPHRGRAESPHLHQFFELLYVERGRGYHLIDGQRFEVREGDLCWMRPGQLHDPGGLGTTWKWIVAFGAQAILPEGNEGQFFLGAQSLALLPFAPVASADRHTRIPAPERPRWVGRFEAIAHELEHKALGYDEAACAHLRLALLDLARIAVARPTGAHPTARPLLSDVFAFIEARFRSPIGLREVAEAVGRSPAYLTDLVRRETGRTVLQWVIDRRLAEARRLLLQSEAPIASIAAEVGYLDAKHFTAQFRRALGMSPHAWRAARQGRTVKKA